MTTVELACDFETASEADLKSAGLANYMAHSSTRALMLAWSFGGGPVSQVDFTDGGVLPSEVKDALLDPHVIKRAYNAAFERCATQKLLGLDTPVQGWRCTMALAYSKSFQGGLEDVGKQIGLEEYALKDDKGRKLVKLFCMPQKPTRKQPHVWCNRDTHPYSWSEFLAYNRQDVIAEMKIADWLLRFPMQEEEWQLYAIDQEINDAGLPVDLRFITNGQKLAWRRKVELMDMMREAAQFTEHQNPGSTKQLLPWLRERGYPFNDLQKNTIKKVLNENEYSETPGFLADDGVHVLKLRQQANRTSVRKLDAMLSRVGEDNRLRHCFQFVGASRTGRWAGRSVQPHNLVRTPKFLEERPVLEAVTTAVRDGDYDMLHLLVDEPMAAIAGAIRSAFRAPEGYEFVVCDLSAIESAVIAWLAGCRGMLEVFRDGLDPYISFGTKLYNRPYELITKAERFVCKPAVLGCGFGLGGGRLREGKRTGLWAYAEAMGVDITQAEAQRQVDVFRDAYFEIPALWARLEDAFRGALKGREVKVGRITVAMRSNFLTMQLPSGRLLFYHKPLILPFTFEKKDGGTYEKRVFTCMGKQQGTNTWRRIRVGGPKACLVAETLVLTDRGWSPIIKVTSGDKVWDGESWVAHGGVVFNGVREVIKVDGVEMTPEHLVLTESGWDEAKNCGNKARHATTLPDCAAAYTWPQSRSNILGSKMRMWTTAVYEGSEVSSRRGLFVRMPERHAARSPRGSARDVQTPSFPCVGVDDRTMHVADKSGMEELWSEGDHGLQAVDDVRELLGRYGRCVSARFGLGQGEQRPRIFAVELPMGHATGKLQQQTEYGRAGYATRPDDAGRSVEIFGNWRDDFILSTEGRMRPVFDILDAGHRNRFVVAGKVGPFIVHNCENVVQAVARDVLALGMRRAYDYGFKLVGSVHDELIALRRKGDTTFSLEALKRCMIEPVPWLKGLPLGADGYVGELYRKG